jgi:hypothetical protein
MPFAPFDASLTFLTEDRPGVRGLAAATAGGGGDCAGDFGAELRVDRRLPSLRDDMIEMEVEVEVKGLEIKCGQRRLSL